MHAANAAEEEYELEFNNTVCATIKKTSDGFLAVRAEPTSNSAMKAKVLSGWEIVLDKKFTSGDWIKARSVYKLVNDEPVNEKALNGWVHRKYVKTQISRTCSDVPRTTSTRFCAARSLPSSRSSSRQSSISSLI
jgi:hypothetical protein